MSDPRHDDKEMDADDVSTLGLFGVSVFKPGSSIPHYYGDWVRQLLLGAAALMMVISPLYSSALRLHFPFIVIGALLAVAVAALMNPHDRWVTIAGAVVSGVGLATYAMWGMFGYDSMHPTEFVLRLAIATVFLFAFYFSMKTLRAFTIHQIGRREILGEFDSEDEKREQEMLEREQTLQGKKDLGL